jgi:biopolymer transport protein ExbD
MGFEKHEMEDLDPDLTPLIDVVFLLLIFMMLITTISQLEDVQLPKTFMSQQPDDKPPKDRLVIDIAKEDSSSEENRNGQFKVKGVPYTESELVSYLRKFKASDGNNEQFRSYIEPMHQGQFFRWARPVLIRCDKRVYYKEFEKLLMLFANPKPTVQIFLYKLEIAIAKDKPSPTD